MLPVATPQELAIDERRLKRVHALLEEWTGGPTPAITAASLSIGRADKMLEPRHFGRMGGAPDAAPVTPQTFYVLASITKPLTYMAAMLLVERGQLNLADKVTRYLPDFAAHHKEDTLVVHLFTHTSGLPDMLENNIELRKEHAPLSRFISGAIRDTVPLFPPGTSVSYQSMGTLVVAEIVQQLSGKSIGEFLRDEIFRPLGLATTQLSSRGLDRSRIVRYPSENGVFDAGTDYDLNSTYWQEFGAPWGGVFSNVEEFSTVCAMMLNGGRHGDVQLLSPATIQAATCNQLENLPDISDSLRRTQPWGLGWRMNHPCVEEQSWGTLMGPRAYGHNGSSGTLTWMDPETGGFFALFTNALFGRHREKFACFSNAVASVF